MKLRKIISWIIVVLPILWLIIFNLFFRYNMILDEWNHANYIAFAIIECLHIIILIYMLLHKFEIKKVMLICIGIYIVTSALIPVYRITKTYPVDDTVDLIELGINTSSGLGIKTNYIDVYGINVTSIIDLFE